MTSSPRARLALALFLGAVLFASPVCAQSVVVSVPSTDVARPGHVMLAHESQLNTWTYGRAYWNSFTFGTYGFAENMELAATLYGLSSPASGRRTVAVGYKHRVPLGTSVWEPTVAFGPMLPVSLEGDGVGIWTYAVMSVRLPGVRTRFSAGPSYGSRQIFGRPTASLLAAIEQPITSRVSFVADWFSGEHELGAFVPAMQWNMTSNFIIIAGVKVPTADRAGPVAGLVELTFEFPVH
ncbi:MAG: hypothetical protein U0270_03145 [Labilithrix sp.]